MSTVIIVACCHRTGSGCVSEILHTLGVPMLEQPTPTRTGDERWEDHEFFRLHQKILRERDPVTNKVDHEKWWFPVPQYNPAHIAEYCDIVNRRLRQPIWGFKDPRTIFMLDFLLGMLALRGANVKIVWLTRDAAAITNSLLARDGEKVAGQLSRVVQRQLTQWQKMFNRYAAAYDSAMISYEDMVTMPAAVVDQLAALLPPTLLTAEKIDNATKVIRPAEEK